LTKTQDLSANWAAVFTAPKFRSLVSTIEIVRSKNNGLAGPGE
jgi:hypothetical protein